MRSYPNERFRDVPAERPILRPFWGSYKAEKARRGLARGRQALRLQRALKKERHDGQ